jgi:hypothetical protein
MKQSTSRFAAFCSPHTELQNPEAQEIRTQANHILLINDSLAKLPHRLVVRPNFNLDNVLLHATKAFSILACCSVGKLLRGCDEAMASACE